MSTEHERQLQRERITALRSAEDDALPRWIVCPRSYDPGVSPHAPRLFVRRATRAYCERCQILVLFRGREWTRNGGEPPGGLREDQVPEVLEHIQRMKEQLYG